MDLLRKDVISFMSFATIWALSRRRVGSSTIYIVMMVPNVEFLHRNYAPSTFYMVLLVMPSLQRNVTELGMQDPKFHIPAPSLFSFFRFKLISKCVPGAFTTAYSHWNTSLLCEIAQRNGKSESRKI
jgi:hypothetical protein